MAYRQAVKTGMYIATMGDSRQDLKMGNFKNVNQGRNFQSSLDRSSSRRDRMRSLDGSHSSMGGSSSRRRKRLQNMRKGLQKQKRQNQLYVPNALQASISSVTVRTYRKVERTLLERFHKFAYRKAMIPMWKMLARFKTFTTFTPDQMRQFLYGVALTMHMFTKYNRRATNLNQQLQSVFLLVFLPFAIPPMVVIGIPLLFFLIPLTILITGFTALNRQAKQVMERNRRNRNAMRSRRASIFTAMGKSVNSTLNMAGTVVGDGIGFTANVAGTVVGGVATGVGEVTRQMSFVGDQILDIGDGVRSTATKLGRRSSRMISNNLGVKRTTGKGGGSGDEGVGRCGSGNKRSSVLCAKNGVKEEEQADEYSNNTRGTGAAARCSSITSSTYFENYNRSNRRHNNSSNTLTNSTLTNSYSWGGDMDMVSSLKSTDTNYSEPLEQRPQPRQPRAPRPLLDSTTIRAMDLSSSDPSAIVDTTPLRSNSSSSSSSHKRGGGQRRRRSSFSTASLRLWRQRNNNNSGSNHHEHHDDDNNNNSSNDTPTTNNTEPSTSSVLRPPSSLAGSRQRRNNQRRRRSGFMMNSQKRSRSRRVSFAAVEEIRLMSERGSSFLGMDDDDDS